MHAKTGTAAPRNDFDLIPELKERSLHPDPKLADRTIEARGFVRSTETKRIFPGYLWIYPATIVLDAELVRRDAQLDIEAVEPEVAADALCSVHAVIHEVSDSSRELDVLDEHGDEEVFCWLGLNDMVIRWVVFVRHAEMVPKR